MTYFTDKKFLLSSDCVEQSKEDPSLIRLLASLGGDDFEDEGTFQTFKNNTPIQHLPWAAGRPIVGGFDYGCLTLVLMLRENNDTGVSVHSAELWDEVCYRPPGYCTLCSVEGPVSEMHVRGLCPESIYDEKYFYNIGEDGQMMFLGEEESMIKYDKVKNLWTWTDRNYPDSSGKKLILCDTINAIFFISNQHFTANIHISWSSLS